jgi:hypothetical protein
MEEEHKRTNERLGKLEEQNETVVSIALSVKELATSVKSMADEQKTQGEKLERLEERDGQMWRKVVGYIVTAVVGILVGFVFQQIGIS